MNKILLILQREYLRRIRKKSFILLTILLPFILIALVAVPMWLSSIQSDEQQTIAIVDWTGRFADAFTDTPEYHFIQAPTLMFEMATDDSGVQAAVNIQSSSDSLMPQVAIYSREEVQSGLYSFVDQTINQRIRQLKCQAIGIPELEQIVSDLDKGIEVRTMKWDKEGREQDSSTGVAMGAGFLLTFLIYGFVLAYCSMVMQSVIEEKTGRIVEIMVSSVRPFQLMMGKMLGIMLVGLTQITIWALTLGILLALGGGLEGIIGDSDTRVAAIQGLPMGQMAVMFVLMFLGAYLLYASFFAAVGASVNEQEDSNQFIMPVTLIMIFSLYAAMGSLENTNGPLAFWSSLFPLTSPMVMMVRIPFGVPLWQQVLSVALLYASALAIVWISARVYRIGILMYGKKPSLRDMLKWLRY